MAAARAALCPPPAAPNWTQWRESVHRAFMNSLLLHIEATTCQGTRLKRLMLVHHACLSVTEKITDLHCAVGNAALAFPSSLAQLQLVMSMCADDIERLMQVFGDDDPLDVMIHHYEDRKKEFFHTHEWASFDLGFYGWNGELFMTYLCTSMPDASKLGRIYQCLLSLDQALCSVWAGTV